MSEYCEPRTPASRQARDAQGTSAAIRTHGTLASETRRELRRQIVSSDTKDVMAWLQFVYVRIRDSTNLPYVGLAGSKSTKALICLLLARSNFFIAFSNSSRHLLYA